MFTSIMMRSRAGSDDAHDTFDSIAADGLNRESAPDQQHLRRGATDAVTNACSLPTSTSRAAKVAGRRSR